MERSALFDLKPKMLLACKNYGREFAKSACENLSVVALKETRLKYDQHTKASKKRLKKLCQNIGGIEKKMAYVAAANEKQLSQLKEVTLHDTRLWDTLNAHVEAVSRGMLQFKDIQVQLNSVLQEDEELEAEAKKLQEKTTGIDATLQGIKEAKEGLLLEVTRLKSVITSQSMEDKAKELQQMKEKLNKGQGSLQGTRKMVSDRLELEATMKGEVTQLKTALEQLNNQINTTVTERNHLELKIEAKGVEENRQLNVIQTKQDMLQELCNVRAVELGAKLTLQREKAQAPITVRLDTFFLISVDS